ARESSGVQQRADFIGDHAQVFGYDRRLAAAECGIDGAEYGLARSFEPHAANCRRGAGGHFPGRFEATEVIDAHQVHQFQQMAEAGDPPRVAFGGHRLPVVQRVAPQLAAGAEVVRWYAGNDDWLASCVEFEQVLVGPYICAVVGDEDRDVAHDAYSKFFGSASERTPL